MPEQKRDLALLEEQSKKVAALRQAAMTYRHQQADYVERFPEAMRRLIPHFAFGQALSEIAYASYEEKTGHSLTEGQHPDEAVITASHFSGNPVHILGDDGVENIGRALVLRVMNAYITNEDKCLRYEGETFISLAAELKQLTTVYDAKSAASEIFEGAYLYHKHGGNMEVLRHVLKDDPDMMTFIEDPYVLDVIKSKEDLFNTVHGNGFKYYEELLVADEQDRKLIDATTAGVERGYPETVEERFIRAMTLEQVIRDRRALLASPHAPDNVVTIYQSTAGKREFVWNPENNKFIVIPEKDEDSPYFEAEKKRFFERIPQNGSWRRIGATLIRGAREYRKTMALKSYTDELGIMLRAYIVSCSDSRSQTIAIMGPRADILRYNLRNPGAMISRLGKMTSDGGRFFAIARKHKKAVVLTAHSNCGAMTAIDAFLSKMGDDLPSPFKKLGQHRTFLYNTVRNKGVPYEPGHPIPSYSDDEIIHHYATVYGAPLKRVADCLSIQQMVNDLTVARREYPDVLTVAVFQNMIECKNYVLNPSTMRLEEVPSAKAFLPSLLGKACGCCADGTSPSCQGIEEDD